MIILKKSGIFRENDYKPDEEGYVYEKVDGIVPYIEEIIKMDEDFTLRDFFNVVGEEMEVMEVLFASALGRHPLAPYLKEVQQDCMPDNREDMDCIECCWVAEQFDYKLFYENHKDDEDDEGSMASHFGKDLHEPDEDSVNEISIYIDVSGWGKYEPEEDEPHSPEMTHTGFAIEFTPLHKMAHLPIKLNTRFVMRGKNEMGSEKPIVEGEKEFSVFEVFSSILSEISFCGSPEERDAQWEDIVDTIDEARKREKDEDEDDEDEDAE